MADVLNQDSGGKGFAPEEMFTGSKHRKRLNQWLATGICGNDITSSCLYVSAIAAVFAGVLTPLVLLLVVGVLYLYKKVYIEVVEALPLNGGTYNCLLNCTSKFAASMAACMPPLITSSEMNPAGPLWSSISIPIRKAMKVKTLKRA
ncbi:MAG: hypothetical protein P1P89_08025 [Desulfobacterales bacterium]|nr:hypothetical protein [Desulfobacterales bacterium]